MTVMQAQLFVSGENDGDWLSGLREAGFHVVVVVAVEWRGGAFAGEADPAGFEGEHAEADEVVAEEDGEEEDEEDEDAVEGGAVQGFGYGEGEVCGVVSGYFPCGWQELHVVSRMVNRVPKKTQPIIFWRSFKSLICGKQNRLFFAGDCFDFCPWRFLLHCLRGTEPSSARNLSR